MKPLAFFDIAFLATLPGRMKTSGSPSRWGLYAYAQRLGRQRWSCVTGSPTPLIEVDAAVHKDLPADVLCDLGYVLWPGKPTTITVCDWHILHTLAAHA